MPPMPLDHALELARPDWQARDWDSLAAHARKRCQADAGAVWTQMLDSIGMGDFQRQLREAFVDALEQAQALGRPAIHYEFAPAEDWAGKIRIRDARPATDTDTWIAGATAHVDAPDFSPFADLYDAQGVEQGHREAVALAMLMVALTLRAAARAADRLDLEGVVISAGYAGGPIVRLVE